MRRIGIVDLGSNTIRLVVYECDPGNFVRLVDQVREPIRLAEGLVESGSLSEAAIKRALTALALFSDFARDTHLQELTVFATSAARDADNGEEFLSRVRDLGLEIVVLDGESEARYGVLGVANGVELEDAWVVDLGGGSAQISRMRNREFDGGSAYPLGAVRATEMFFASDPPTAKEADKLRAFVKKQLGGVLDEMREDGKPMVALGGTIRNLARAIQMSHDYPLDQVHGYFLERRDLEELTRRMLSHKAKRRARIAGINPDRADIIVAGALVFETLLREADLRGLTVSGLGLRDGLLYSRVLPEPHLVPVVRKFAVRNLFQQYPQPMEHTEHVRFLSRRLFDELKPLHGYGWEEARILDDAARLHDIGMAVGYHGHHRHGAFLIDNSLMPGISHREKALLILLVRFHRKGKPKTGALRKLLEPGDEELLLRLTCCLRLAEYLERARANRIKDVEVEIGKRAVDIKLIARQYPGVEVYEAEKQAELFQLAYGRKLRVHSNMNEAAAS